MIRENPDGSYLVLNEDDGYLIEKAGTASIPKEIDHMPKGRRQWDDFFKPHLHSAMDRVDQTMVTIDGVSKPFNQGGRELLQGERQQVYGLYCGGLIGVIRDWLGLVGMCYLMVGDELLLDENIETVDELSYQEVKQIWDMGAQFGFAHFWEDIAYKNGPLINPGMFCRKFGRHYRRKLNYCVRMG